MIKKLFFWGLIFITPIWASSLLQAQNSPKLTGSNIKQVIASMTLQEKSRLVVGTGMFFELPDSILKRMPGGRNPFAPPADANTTYNLMISQVRKLVPGAAGTTAELSRLGITPMVVSDGPAGVRINPIRKK